MKRLYIYLRDYKKECVLAPLFKMLEASFELIVPLVMAAIIDTGIEQGDKSYIVNMCLILVALGIVGLVCSITAQFYSAKAAVGFATKLRHALFAHLLDLSFTEIDTLGTSTMITRMTSDVNQTQTGVNMVLRLFLRSPFVVFGAMIMAFTIDTKSAGIFLIAIVLLSIVVFGIMAISIPMLKRVQKNLDSVLQITRENLLGVRVIRAFCGEDKERKEFHQRNSELTKKQKKAGFISALMNPVTYVIINIAIAYLIWVGAIQVDHGVLTQGQVVALYSYMSQILVELIKLANLIVTVNKSAACAKRVADVFDIKNSMEFKNCEKLSLEKEDIIEFRNVSLEYQGAGDESLSDINFSAKKGQTIGIIGGTGSGKSSLVNLLPRFYDATNGEVLIGGKNVKHYSVKELRDKIGIVMQKAVMFEGTIESNLIFGKKEARQEELEDAITIAQATDVVNAKGGFNASIEQGGRNLSGGQKQRLSIARALVKKPEILILDDSASALDYATDAKLRSAIKNLSYQPTVFIVSQRAASILHADLILVLEDGRLVGKGTHNELIESCEVYQEIYYSQFPKEVQA
ncbi:ABC transporter ATP-binding protein [Lachnoclostridium phytofermentans]|uniref:ABC transporter ATP-binding protein n=1 Tax=Lachnoclostridium phytofermentans TaxID=66219 RepID=UPI0004971D90|nr:ABC transporter ATP-binding protein [Lachnoclostridium phytofermentans]